MRDGTRLVPNEKWLPVLGYEGSYEVSDRGRVRSLDRYIQRRSNRMFSRGRILKPCLTHGYPTVNLTGKTRQVHVLMLQSFVGPRPRGMYGCHRDDVRTNNVLSNLRWDTPAANSADKSRHGRDWQRNKTCCPSGHLLVAPNLVACIARIGRRACLACCRARSIHADRLRRGRPGFDIHHHADLVFADLMRGGPGTVRSVTGGLDSFVA